MREFESSRMKWIRRLLIAALLGVVLLLIASAVGYKLLHGRPDWYKPLSSDPQATRLAADRANQRLIDAASRTARLQNELRHPEVSAINARRTGDAAVPERLQLNLSEEELNAFFESWDQLEHWSGRYSRLIREPQLILHDHHLMLAATAVDLDTVISVEVSPVLRDGKLYLRLVRVAGGNLPLPRSFWESYRSRLVAAVAAHLPKYRKGATIDADGWANEAMVAAVTGKLFVDAIDDRPASPVLFFPTMQSMKRKYLPVRLTAVEIDKEILHLDFAPLTVGERDALIDSASPPAVSADVAPRENSGP